MFRQLKKLFTQYNNTAMAEALLNGAVLVDVRMPSEFSEGSVKGATNIPLSRLVKQLPLLDKKNIIIVFCGNGIRGSQAKELLENNGFKNVINGGSWQNVQQVITKTLTI